MASVLNYLEGVFVAPLVLATDSEPEILRKRVVMSLSLFSMAAYVPFVCIAIGTDENLFPAGVTIACQCLTSVGLCIYARKQKRIRDAVLNIYFFAAAVAVCLACRLLEELYIAPFSMLAYLQAARLCQLRSGVFAVLVVALATSISNIVSVTYRSNPAMGLTSSTYSSVTIALYVSSVVQLLVCFFHSPTHIFHMRDQEKGNYLNLQIVEDVSRALANFTTDEATYLLDAVDPVDRTPVVESLSEVVANLAFYRTYLPKALFTTSAADDNNNDEGSISPLSSNIHHSELPADFNHSGGDVPLELLQRHNQHDFSTSEQSRQHSGIVVSSSGTSTRRSSVIRSDARNPSGTIHHGQEAREIVIGPSRISRKASVLQIEFSPGGSSHYARALFRADKPLIGNHLPAIQQAVSFHRGVVDLVTDSTIVVTFGAHFTLVLHEEVAVQCAMQLLADERLPRTMSVAVGAGTVSIANMGSAEHKWRLVGGGVVNVVNAVSALQRQTHTRLLVTDAVARQLNSFITIPVDVIRVGPKTSRQQDVTLFEVAEKASFLGDLSVENSPSRMEQSPAYLSALAMEMKMVIGLIKKGEHADALEVLARYPTRFQSLRESLQNVLDSTKAEDANNHLPLQWPPNRPPFSRVFRPWLLVRGEVGSSGDAPPVPPQLPSLPSFQGQTTPSSYSSSSLQTQKGGSPQRNAMSAMVVGAIKMPSLGERSTSSSGDGLALPSDTLKLAQMAPTTNMDPSTSSLAHLMSSGSLYKITGGFGGLDRSFQPKIDEGLEDPSTTIDNSLALRERTLTCAADFAAAPPRVDHHLPPAGGISVIATSPHDILAEADLWGPRWGKQLLGYKPASSASRGYAPSNPLAINSLLAFGPSGDIAIGVTVKTATCIRESSSFFVALRKHFKSLQQVDSGNLASSVYPPPVPPHDNLCPYVALVVRVRETKQHPKGGNPPGSSNNNNGRPAMTRANSSPDLLESVYSSTTEEGRNSRAEYTGTLASSPSLKEDDTSLVGLQQKEPTSNPPSPPSRGGAPTPNEPQLENGDSDNASCDVTSVFSQYISGGSVLTMLTDLGNMLPLPAWQNYLRDTIAAVAHLHSHRAVHGCVQPRCILVNSDGSCSLSDYGGFYRWENAICDTRPYLAPELFNLPRHERDGNAPKTPKTNSNSSAIPTAASDVWGIGATALHLFLGRMPFIDQPNNQLYAALAAPAENHRDAAVTSPVDRGGGGVECTLDRLLQDRAAPTPVVMLVKACLQLDPANRATISTLQTMATAW